MPTMLKVFRNSSIKALAVLTSISLAVISSAAPTYLGLYMQKHKIGFASYATTHVTYLGKPAERSDTQTVMDTGLLGTPLRVVIESQTWCKKNGEPIQMNFNMKSQGRGQKVDATFGPTKVVIVVNNSGTATKRTLDRPNGLVVDDPISLILKGKRSVKCFILDPSTVSFIENDVRVVGKHLETINGKSINVMVVDIQDPRATTRVYLTPNGSLLRAEGPMGITMIPESAAVAMVKPGKYSPKVDLAYSTSIVPKGELTDPAGTSQLKLKLLGKDLSSAPSDETQTVTKAGEAWIVEVHPTKIGEDGSIATAAHQKPNWTKPDLNMPSDDDKFRKLAKQIVGKRSQVEDAAMAIKQWVYEQMHPNASIAVLRDANEVLKTKEGVCRDYAILTGTLLRSAGIPTRLASGLVDWDGTFYYHAWDEVWNGKHWIGIDSTTPDKQISAAHVKLSDGTVAQAFTFAVLDKVSIEILASRGH